MSLFYFPPEKVSALTAGVAALNCKFLAVFLFQSLVTFHCFILLYFLGLFLLVLFFLRSHWEFVTLNAFLPFSYINEKLFLIYIYIYINE